MQMTQLQLLMRYMKKSSRYHRLMKASFSEVSKYSIFIVGYGPSINEGSQEPGFTENENHEMDMQSFLRSVLLWMDLYPIYVLIKHNKYMYIKIYEQIGKAAKVQRRVRVP